MSSIIKQLKTARQTTKLSQAQLGEMLGLPQSHISRIEAGGVDPRLSSLTEMARALGYELMLIPRPSKTMIEAMLSDDKDALTQPRWQLDEE